MRASEIFESENVADLPTGSTQAMPKAMIVPDMDPYYEFYRFVVALAGLPDTNIPLQSVVKDKPMIIPYSQQEYDAVMAILKRMGRSPKNLTSSKSLEQPNTHTVSPIRKFKDYM